MGDKNTQFTAKSHFYHNIYESYSSFKMRGNYYYHCVFIFQSNKMITTLHEIRITSTNEKLNREVI